MPSFLTDIKLDNIKSKGSASSTAMWREADPLLYGSCSSGGGRPFLCRRGCPFDDFSTILANENDTRETSDIIAVVAN